MARQSIPPAQCRVSIEALSRLRHAVSSSLLLSSLRIRRSRFEDVSV
jgi:hypothetical protein